MLSNRTLRVIPLLMSHRGLLSDLSPITKVAGKKANPGDIVSGVRSCMIQNDQKLKLMPPKPTTMSRFASAKVVATPVLTWPCNR